MADIPPILWIVIGVGVAVTSMLVPALTIFVAAGIVFILVGIVKLVRSSDDTKTLANKNAYHTVSPRAEAQATANTRICFVCSAKNNALANFCGHCGHRLQ